MKKYLFLVFYVSFYRSTAQENLSMYQTVIIDKHKITFEYEHSKTCYKLWYDDQKQYFKVRDAKIYLHLSKSNDSLLNSLLQFIGKRYEIPLRPPSTFPIVRVGFLVNEKGEIIEKGFCLPSTDENFNNQIVEILSAFDYSFQPFLLLNKPVGFFICVRFDFYQLLDVIQQKK